MTPTNAQPITLVIADVDGTLVSKEKILTARAIASINKMREVGVRFAITSGRPPLGMAMLIDPLKIDQPVAAFNGGVLIQPDLKTVVRENFLPLEIVKKAFDLHFILRSDIRLAKGHQGIYLVTRIKKQPADGRIRNILLRQTYRTQMVFHHFLDKLHFFIQRQLQPGKDLGDHSAAHHLMTMKGPAMTALEFLCRGLADIVQDRCPAQP